MSRHCQKFLRDKIATPPMPPSALENNQVKLRLTWLSKRTFPTLQVNGIKTKKRKRKGDFLIKEKKWTFCVKVKSKSGGGVDKVKNVSFWGITHTVCSEPGIDQSNVRARSSYTLLDSASAWGALPTPITWIRKLKLRKIWSHLQALKDSRWRQRL